MTRAIVIHWSSAYGSIRGLMQLHVQTLRQLGVQVVEVDISTAGWEGTLLAALDRADFRFALITSGIGLDIAADGQNLWEREQVPVFSLQLDLPAYRHASHRTRPPNFVHGYMFRDHALFQQAHVGAENLVTSVHFGVPDLPIRTLSPADRPRVVFPKTGGAPAELERAWRELPMIGPLLLDLMDEVGFGNCDTFVPAVTKVASAYGIELRPFDKLSRFLLAQVDDYTRRRKSTMLAQALTGFPVDVYGHSWEHVTRGGEGKARFHGAVPFASVEAAIAGAGATVTMNPNVDLSVHDRFFLAAGAGKIPISDRNRFSREECPLLEPYLFEFTPESIAASLENYFADPAAAAERAEATRAQLRAKFPMEATIKHIIECTALVQYLEYAFKPPQNFFVAGG